MENIETDYRVVADVVVCKFKKIISLLGCTRTGHAHFRKTHVAKNQSLMSFFVFLCCVV